MPPTAAMGGTGDESCCQCSPAPGAPQPLERQIRLPLLPRNGGRKHPPDVADPAARGLTSQKNAEGRMVHPSNQRVNIVLPPVATCSNRIVNSRQQCGPAPATYLHR